MVISFLEKTLTELPGVQLHTAMITVSNAMGWAFCNNFVKCKTRMVLSGEIATGLP